jgi:serine protease
MKPHLFYGILVASLCSAAGASAQDYYWVHGQKVSITRDSSRFVVETQTEATTADINSYLATRAQVGKVQPGNQPNRFLVNVTGRTKATSAANRVSQLKSSILATYYSFKLPDGEKVTPTGDVIFQPKKNVSYTVILQQLGSEARLVKQTAYNTFIIRPTSPSQLLAVANRIYESGLVDWCQPDLYAQRRLFQDDPLYSSQYYLNNTGQTGGATNMDINAPEAWCLTKGSAAIRVAVIDEGVESHEDLDPQLVAGYDPRYPSSTGSPRGSVNGHGVACAGIIGASHNSIGVAGIAPASKLIPVNIVDAGDAFYSDAEITAALNWAWDPTKGNADVLSNSWGGGPYSDPIASAITNALTQGRGGKGCLVVFASGNTLPYQGVAFPANVNGVVTVGAVDKAGTIWNYSCRGPEMDLVAPSGDVNFVGDLYTTDRMNGNGYSTGNYMTNFGGTSAACPQVAGVGALVLAANPNLTQAQVANILTSTATDMGSGGFDTTFGYGRVNAYSAVLSALAYSVSGPASFCSGSAAYSANAPTGTTTVWSSSNTSVATINSSTGVATAVGSGLVTFTASATTSCGSTITASKQVQVGTPAVAGTYYCTGCSPSSSGTISTYGNYVKTGTITLYVNQEPNTTYSFSGYPSSVSQSGPNSAYFYINSSNTYQQRVDVTITKTSSCGTISQTFTFVAYPSSSYLLSPNPANSELNVTSVEADQPTDVVNGTATLPFEAQLYDNFGKQVKTKSSDGNNAKLNVSDLPNGLYYLRVGKGKEAISKQIQIAH